MDENYFKPKAVHFKSNSYRMLQLQVVGEDANHGQASVGVTIDRNRDRKFEMHPPKKPFTRRF